MTTDEAIEPLRLSFEVGCAPEQAFRTWTERISTWWPADHTVTGDRDLVVVLEPRVGGRLFERTRGGDEHDWGRITAWEPPHRLVYTWHLRADRADATDVEIRFVPADGGTRVEIEHRGWERLGAERGRDRRDRNFGGWRTLLPHYRQAVESGL
jgi:uncharacterized protein YndB with AHSA1/START domain